MSGLLKKTRFDSNLISTIFHYSELGSTNSVAKRMILQEKEEAFGVLSETQTAGYGQRGNFWESPPGGLWGSLAFKPVINPSKMGLIPSLCALSVAKALMSHHINTRLKWPNDILYSDDNKKLGGIIVEGKVSSSLVEYLIVGIGLNVNTPIDRYSPTLRNNITTTLEITKNNISVEKLLHTIIYHLEEGLNEIKMGVENKILAAWKKWENILGMPIRITSNNIQYEGIAKDLTLYGQMVLELADGRKIIFSSGAVTLL
ncbi:MAG: biotin--[acetyl-CoA-carboxylase] ligase [Candidatus Hodarchaeales archaeon]|jgi:BirA family biotin operon repressor/biotin-[acetyl-CoA-carboxylase] ligase